MYVILVLLLLLLFFAVYSHYLSVCDEKRNEEGRREIKQAYKRVIKRHLLSISALDRFGSRLIAMDPVGKLLLIVHKDDVTWEKCIDMDDILFCRVVKTAGKMDGSIQDITMELTFRNNHEMVEFPFFDERLDNRSDFSQRLKKSQAWKKRIQLPLSSRQLLVLV